MDIDDIYKPVHMRMMDIGLRRVPEGLLEAYNVDMDPDYQRDHVWTVEQRQKYVGFILQGGKTLPIVLNQPDGLGSENAEVVDGKQRLTSIRMWLEGDIDAELHDGRMVNGPEMLKKPTNRAKMTTQIMVSIGFTELDREGVLDYYLRLNNGGSIHSDEEIERVRSLLEQERNQ